MSKKPVYRILLNGKKAGIPAIREAIYKARDQYTEADIQVRVTWEYRDLHRFVQEAVNESVDRLIVGGGDGSVNELVDALAAHPLEARIPFGILPLGTANDFATACQIPTGHYEAISLAIEGRAEAIDIGRCNDRFFVNIAAGGFGAQVTAETPVELKNFLGGSAYTLTGLVKALNFTPYPGVVSGDHGELTGGLIVGAVCNGRQAGGGQQLAPTAYINDGVLDFVMMTEFPIEDLNLVIKEALDPQVSGKYVKRFQSKKLSYQSLAEAAAPLNLDGEPYHQNSIEFEAVPGAVQLVVPDNCPVIL